MTSKTEIDIERRTDFINIPATIEKKTRPSLYSFLSGLKKVLKSKGTDSKAET
jgi:hypothetical protein